METIAYKLSKIIQIKNECNYAINIKNVNIANSEKFENYPDKILLIEDNIETNNNTIISFTKAKKLSAVQKLIETKNNIKKAIEAKGVLCYNTKFTEYPNKIMEIGTLIKVDSFNNDFNENTYT